MNSQMLNGWALLVAVAVLTVASAPRKVNAQSRQPGSVAPQIKSVVIGKLIRAGRTQNGKPKFGLLDEKGNLTSHVIPVAGLNLTQFVSRQVGVTVRSATRGKDNLPYLLAQKVTSLSADDANSPVAMKNSDSNTGVWDMEGVDLDGAETDFATHAGGSNKVVDMPEFVGANVSSAKGTIDEFSTQSLVPEELEIGSTVTLNEVVIDDNQPIGAAILKADHVLPIAETQEPIHFHDPTILGEPTFHDLSIGISNGGCNTPGCTSCGGGVSNCLTPDCCPCGPSGKYWIRADYVMWWTKGMDLPDLVTTSPSNTSSANAGVRGVNGTSVLFGGDEVLTDARNGARFRFGKWCDACQWVGFEGDFFFIGEESDGFSQTSTGAPILARPFFNTNLNQEDSELIAYPGVVSGALNIDLNTELHSFSPRLRFNLRCENFCTEPSQACGPGNGCGGAWCNLPGGQRIDFTLGYRYVNLEEMLSINERLVTDQNGVTSTFDVTDAFKTENDFHGVDLGLLWERYRGAWSLELLGRVGLGNTRQRVEIGGTTATSTAGVSFSDPGGILALQSNIGQYSSDTFSVLPELGASLGYRIAPNMRFMFGYTFLYWSDVVRPGDQIDLNVNPDLIPPVQNTTGPDSPAFVLNEADFWAQGLTFGLDYRW